MAYDVKLFKLINGDMVIGKWDAENKKLTIPQSFRPFLLSRACR